MVWQANKWVCVFLPDRRRQSSQRRHNLLHIISVFDDTRFPTKRFPFIRQRLQRHSIFRPAVTLNGFLSQWPQIAKLVMSSQHDGLPIGTFINSPSPVMQKHATQPVHATGESIPTARKAHVPKNRWKPQSLQYICSWDVAQITANPVVTVVKFFFVVHTHIGENIVNETT